MTDSASPAIPAPDASIDMRQTAPRTRTEGRQAEMIPCAYCHVLFAPRKPGRFCSPKHRAAYSREVGLVGEVIGVRRLTKRVSVIIHCDDDRSLDLALHTRVRIVKEPL